jgi:hypothetical protein
MHRERGGQIRFGSMLSKKGLRDGLNDDSCSLNESGKIRSIAEYRLKQQLMERFLLPGRPGHPAQNAVLTLAK